MSNTNAALAQAIIKQKDERIEELQGFAKMAHIAVGEMQGELDRANKRIEELEATIKRIEGPPTKAMLKAARDWSKAKYGKPIGSEDATGCWEVMREAALTAEQEQGDE